MTITSDDVKALFRPERLGDYEFGHAPELVTLRSSEVTAHSGLDRNTADQWKRIQHGFLDRARRPDKYPREKLLDIRERFGAVFAEHGPLTGRVLDIGGGWGLYREWWEPAGGGPFVVHDPGVERFREGPHDSHREVFVRAFSLPMVFVEGLGESLPYHDETFDTCVIAAALDHCANPAVVLAEAHRCLRWGGRLMLFQTCEPPRVIRSMNRARRLWRALRRPGALIGRLRRRITAPPDHMFRFTDSELQALLLQVGFARVVRIELDEAPVLFIGGKDHA